MSLAFLFPGQGSQAVGMGAELAEAFAAARAVFEEVDDALAQKLGKLMREGPIEDLTLTENAQPALMAVSLAVMRVLQAEFGVGVERAAFVAGHSLGEYSALAAAGAITLADTARLLRLRGQAMQRAVPVGQGAMASLIGPKTDLALAEAAALAGAAAGVCVVANDNNAGNVVISGDKAAVDPAIEAAKALGARAIPLNVSAPFHCPLMQPAADEMAAALARIDITPPRAPLVANITARPTLDPDAIRALLVEQVTGRVRWRESMIWLAGEGGVTRFAEAGAGKVLTGMAKRIAPDAEAERAEHARRPRSLRQGALSVGPPLPWRRRCVADRQHGVAQPSMRRIGVHPRMPHHRHRDRRRADGKVEADQASRGVAARETRTRRQRDQVRLARDTHRIREARDDGDDLSSEPELFQRVVDRPREASPCATPRHDGIAA